MAKNGFRIIDSDMHVMEPTDLWERYIDPAYSDRSPRSVPRHRGDLVMRVEGREMAAEAQWEIELADDPNWLASYADGLANGWDGPSQRRAMDSEGLDLAILYPSRGLYALAVDGMDPALASAIAVAYNDWLYDFCAADRARMLGAGMVSPFDVGSAVEEARRSVKEMGFKAVFMRPNVVNGRNWYYPYYDPLWAEIEDLNVPLGFHEGSDAGVPQTGDQFLEDSWLMHHTCTHPMEMMLALVSMVGGGVLARFPKLRVGFLEGNCSWTPWMLWRLDEHYELVGRHESPELTLEPTEYFLRQCWVSVEADEEPARFIEGSGLEGNVVFSTDYPHKDSKYPKAVEAFLRTSFSEETKRRILWDNCVRMYGLGI